MDKTGGLYSATCTALRSGEVDAQNPHQAMVYLLNKIVFPVVDKKTGKEHRRRHEHFIPSDMVNTQVSIVSTGEKMFVRFIPTPEDIELHKTAAMEHVKHSFETTRDMLERAEVTVTQRPCNILEINIPSLKQVVLKAQATPVGKYMKKLRAEKNAPPYEGNGINPG